MSYKKIFHKLAKEFNLEVKPTAMFFGKRATYPGITGSLMKWYETGDEFYMATDVKFISNLSNTECKCTFANIHEFYGSYDSIRLEVMKLLEKIKKAKIEAKKTELEGDFK